MRQAAASLAQRGVYVGTSSWKYPGWRGLLYDEARYVYRGRIAETRFEKHCLTEYSEVFKTVSVDAAYYTFPGEKYLQGLAAQVPSDFRFGFKVTGEITMRRFPTLPRYGIRSGKPNENFLNADLFCQAFLKPCESISTKVGVVMFEFSRFYPSDYAHGSDFVADLGRFLSKLPPGWPYAVEIRNKHWLAPEYFACLAKYRVAHVFNSWEAMPCVSEQMAHSDSLTNPELAVARFLLRPGRKYEDAVKTFHPYDRTKEVNEEARKAGAELIKKGLADGTKRQTFIFVNNRMEGNALETIASMVESADGDLVRQSECAQVSGH